jgi:hypothetical protein
MDGRLRFFNHVVETSRACFYGLSVLYKIRNYLDVNVRVRICESLVLSKLNYTDVVIGECLYGYTQQLIQRVQNACARFCYDIPRRAHVIPYLNSGGLMNMKTRRSFHFACLLFGIIKTKSPAYLYNKLSFCCRSVRVGCHLVYQKHSTAAFRGSFRYSATKCWNNIPPPLRCCRTLRSFKFNFKKYLLDLQ